MRWNLDFNETPLIVIWEVTRSCELACRHCRAEAIPGRDPDELTLDEGKALLDEIAAMGTPLTVFSGGDPLQRPDLEELVAHGKGLGLRVGTIPAATARLTQKRVRSLKQAGLDQMALSLDGSTREAHDDFRQVPGSYAKTLEGAAWARLEGMPLQFNTVFGSWNADDFDGLADLVLAMGVVFWEIFFLVPTGRGIGVSGCTVEEQQYLFGRILAFAQKHDVHVKVTEAPHYRGYVLEQTRANGRAWPVDDRGRVDLSTAPGGVRALTGLGVNSGKGHCFIDHLGNICPSGFLPLVCGNVREHRLSDIYREGDLFRQLRDENLLEGRCHDCAYRVICGGSRARAYAVSGSLFAEEADCPLG